MGIALGRVGEDLSPEPRDQKGGARRVRGAGVPGSLSSRGEAGGAAGQRAHRGWFQVPALWRGGGSSPTRPGRLGAAAVGQRVLAARARRAKHAEAVMVEEQPGAGCRAPTRRRTAAPLPSAPRQGAARLVETRAATGAGREWAR